MSTPDCRCGEPSFGRCAAKHPVCGNCADKHADCKPSQTKLPAGTRVTVLLADDLSDPMSVKEVSGTVVRHGRDRSGIYTEVRLNDGTTERVHRANVRVIPGAVAATDDAL